MTDDRMALIELIEKDADADLVREMLAFAAGRVMELEAAARRVRRRAFPHLSRPPHHIRFAGRSEGIKAHCGAGSLPLAGRSRVCREWWSGAGIPPAARVQ